MVGPLNQFLYSTSNSASAIGSSVIFRSHFCRNVYNTARSNLNLGVIASTNLTHNVHNGKCRHFYSSCNKQTLANTNSKLVGEVSSSKAGPEQPDIKLWDLYAGVCLERKPIITKELSQMEHKYANFLEEFELESSKLSNHEVRHKKDLHLLEKIKKGQIDKGDIQTAQDFEDTCLKELMKFIPLKLARTTEADKTKDTKSLQRALDSHLVLVVQQKLGKEFKWICPQLKRIEGETLRQTAERTISEICPNVKVRILGNAPWGFYKYKYPPGIQNHNGKEVNGAKVFFYKANHLSGNVETIKSENILIKDFQWLTRSELEETLIDEYHSSISQFLIEED